MSAQQKNLSGIIMTFMYMLIGLALTPTVQAQVNAVTGAGAGNLTGAALAICQLVPLFWVILIIATGLASIVVWLKQ